ncbi:type II toxin-antitoxin system prevent-host-death family antitoxin [Paenibacillus koleovorans]|uniref:type II toxin-antitoxin system prevent-host-death family antitoxin n=1 Tax=Paenibacillus koleovorans TaxID=121608 RepID=UPI000FDC2E3C|nr:type II toxin-antitoxin system prevent-host-death family antitoxin [Paenibacillus koleovorans]
MKISSTELQNNFGKYLMLAAHEDIIVTRNGTEIAKLSGIIDESSDFVTVSKSKSNKVMEQPAPYNVEGRKATFEEYMELVEHSEDRYEYIDGEIYLLASPRTAHQIAQIELTVILYNWFRGSKCTPLVAPYDIKLYRSPERKNVVQPDIMVICDLEEHLDENDYYQGIPSLVVEIISESSRRKDLVKKLDLYMCCGIKEYWIVNPLNKEITVYLFENQSISQNVTYKNNEIAHSFLFSGLAVELAAIFKGSTP